MNNAEEKIVKPVYREPVSPPKETITETARGKKGVISPFVEEAEKQEQKQQEKEAEGNGKLGEEEVQGLIPQDYYRTSPLFYEVVNYFGLGERDYDEAKNKLSVIVDWAIRRAKSNKVEDVLTEIRGVERVMQPPTWDERRYKKVYGYIRLLVQKEAIEKTMGAYERAEKESKKQKRENGNSKLAGYSKGIKKLMALYEKDNSTI